VSNQRFVSSYAGTLDSKGRVCIPAPFRQVLVAQNTTGAFVCPSLAGGALDVFGQELMDAQLKRLDQYDPFLSELHDDLASQIIAETRPLPVDENGRIRLPDEMIKAANLKDAVCFVGMGQKFEIWNPEDYASVKAKRLAGARAARAAEQSARMAPVPTTSGSEGA
jgi:MraZ protein